MLSWVLLVWRPTKASVVACCRVRQVGFWRLRARWISVVASGEPGEMLNTFGQLLKDNMSQINNLQANIAAGRGNTFAYTGVAGTSPLPIFFAHAAGAGNATNPSAYTGTFWTNTTLVNSLVPLNPQPYTAAGNLRTNFRTNMLNAGLPANFWVANPDVANAQMVANGGKTYYNGIQLSLNRRFAGGFQAQANYSFGDAWQDEFLGFRKDYLRVKQSQTRADLTAGSGNVAHVLAVNWVYELPFGNGRPAARGNALTNR